MMPSSVAIGHSESAIKLQPRTNRAIEVKVGVAKSDVGCPDRRVQLTFRKFNWLSGQIEPAAIRSQEVPERPNYRSNIIQTVVVDVTNFDITEARRKVKGRNQWQRISGNQHPPISIPKPIPSEISQPKCHSRQ